MRIESVSPSSEMLRACVEKCPGFSVFYKGGIIVSVDRLGEMGWELTRYKNEREVSSFKFSYDGAVLAEGSDFLVTSMIKSMWEGYRQAPGLEIHEVRSIANFIETAMRVYGGKIADIKHVVVDDDTNSEYVNM